MNLILLFEDDFTDGRDHVCLKDRRYKHVCNIHRASVGDKLRVGLCGGQIGTGRITMLDNDRLEMDVVFDQDAPKALPVTLILALPRPIMCKRILATVTAIGVKRIILIHSHRVEKSYWKSPVLSDDKIKEQLVLGLEQAQDTLLPQVQLRPRFKPFVEDELPEIAEGTRTLLAHPDAAEPCPTNVEEPVTLIIGPEGGFIPYEIEKLTDLGFQPVHLGERVLRVETAVPAALSKLF